jgi:hypothetical protein
MAGAWMLRARMGDGPATAVRLNAPRLTAMLHDERRARPGGILEWRTVWRLCWSPQAGARGYELQALLGEGGAGRPRPAHGRCHSLEVASGRNPARHGLRYRDVQLALQAGQLAYRVRARLSTGRPGPWSRSLAAGEAFP